MRFILRSDIGERGMVLDLGIDQLLLASHDKDCIPFLCFTLNAKQMMLLRDKLNNELGDK